MKVFYTNIPQSLLISNSNKQKKNPTVSKQQLANQVQTPIYKQRIQNNIMPPSLTAFNVNQSYISNLEQQLKSNIVGLGNSGFKPTKNCF